MNYQTFPLPSSGHPDVTLRWLQPDDAHAWYDYLCLPQVVGQTSWTLSSVDDLAPVFDALAPRAAVPQLRLAIVDARHRLVGTLGFHSINAPHGSAEIAYELSPAVWHRGIATAVCGQVVPWAFACFGWQRIQAAVLDSNHASARVLHRCAFQHEGRLRSFRRVGGVPRHFDLYARLAGDPTTVHCARA